MSVTFEMRSEFATQRFIKYLITYAYPHIKKGQCVEVVVEDEEDLDRMDRFCRSRQLYPIRYFLTSRNKG